MRQKMGKFKKWYIDYQYLIIFNKMAFNYIFEKSIYFINI
jgi:hypothetical protein